MVERMGYRNSSKGIRRVTALLNGDRSLATELRMPLAKVLDLDVSEINAVMRADAMERQKAFEASFVPHAIVLTANTVPSPIFAAALIGAEKLLRIDFKEGTSPVTFAGQALKKLPVGVPTFGKTIGFVVNYRPDYAVRFHLSGKVIDVFSRAVTTGTLLACIGSRPFAINMEKQ